MVVVIAERVIEKVGQVLYIIEVGGVRAGVIDHMLQLI
jgi:hypothetical protein